MKLTTLLRYQKSYNILREAEIDRRPLTKDEFMEALKAKSVFDGELVDFTKPIEVAVTDIDWEMKIPVISTNHMPSSVALTLLSETTTCADYAEGGFVYIPETEGRWTTPIFKWLRSRGENRWVRFDRDADVVEELPTYDW